MADRSRGTRGGFTLIEMLVALAVFSLAAMALLNLSGENTRSAARVETRILGDLVAENLAVEAMIDPRIAEGESNGAVPLAGRQWRWTRSVQSAEAGMLRIEIAVATEEGRAADRILFRARP